MEILVQVFSYWFFMRFFHFLVETSFIFHIQFYSPYFSKVLKGKKLDKFTKFLSHKFEKFVI